MLEEVSDILSLGGRSAYNWLENHIPVDELLGVKSKIMRIENANVQNDLVSQINVDVVIQQQQHASAAAADADLEWVDDNNDYDKEQEKLEEGQNKLRTEITKVIERQIFGSGSSRGGFDPHDVHRKISVTRRFLWNNPEVVVLQADKGNKTVISLGSEYDGKMMDLRGDTNTYEKLESDPTMNRGSMDY